MKGNIFSIEILLGVILVISIISLIYSSNTFETDNQFELIKLNSNSLNVFYFGENANTTTGENVICETIAYFDDSNNIGTKQTCEGI